MVEQLRDNYVHSKEKIQDELVLTSEDFIEMQTELIYNRREDKFYIRKTFIRLNKTVKYEIGYSEAKRYV